MREDAQLLDLWSKFKAAIAYECMAPSQAIADRRFAKALALEQEIMGIQPKGPIGEIIQLGIERWGELRPATDHYRELALLTGMDVLAELDALFCREKPSNNVVPFKRP